MIVTLKPRTVRRIGPNSLYVVLPQEYLGTHGIVAGTEVEMFMDSAKPEQLIIRKKAAGAKRSRK